MTKVKSCSVYIVTGKKEEELDVSSVKSWWNHAASCHAENQARVNRLEEYIENISMVGIGFHIKTTQGFLYFL